MIVVVDTNVAIVANKKAEQASPECVTACDRRLRYLMATDLLVIDDSWRILREYLANLRSEGQPGVGDAFLKWVLLNRNNSSRVVQVKITPLVDMPTNFLEFPDDDRLRNFDPSDRKFVAVAQAHPEKPPILEAVDSKWWQFKEILREKGVQVEFLCPDDIQHLIADNEMH